MNKTISDQDEAQAAIQVACLKIYESILPVEATLTLIGTLMQKGIIDENTTLADLIKILKQKMEDYDLMADQLRAQL